MTRQALSATLGAVAGVGLGVGALVWVRGAQEAVRDDAGTRAAFATFMENGPENGIWEIETPLSTQKRRFQSNPGVPGTMLVTDLDDSLQRVRPIPTDWIARRLAGDADLFLRGYGPAGPPVVETVGDRRSVGMRYKRTGCAACSSRTIYMDLVGRFVTRVEDHAYDGSLVQKISLVTKDKPSGVAAPALPRPSNGARMTFTEWVATSPMPIYEPARLPEGFVRVAFGVLPLDKKDGSLRLRPAVVSYSDGVARIELLIATKEDMVIVDQVARDFQKTAGPSTCPATSDSVTETEVDGPHIKRRIDRCRIVLRREDLPTVVVMLIGFNEIPEHLYIETIQSLVKVSK